MRGWNIFDARPEPFLWCMFFFPFLLPFHRNCLLKGISPLPPLLLSPSVFFLPNPSNYLSNTNGITQSFPGSKYSGGEGEYLSNTNGIIQSFPECKYSRREGEYLSNTNEIIQSSPGSKYSGREGEYLSNTNGIIQSFPVCKYSGRNKENQKN